jgi:hypothetical protein
VIIIETPSPVEDVASWRDSAVSPPPAHADPGLGCLRSTHVEDVGGDAEKDDVVGADSFRKPLRTRAESDADTTA